MKKQRIIHLLSALGQIIGVLLGWRYLPPWLLWNPGVIILVCVFAIESALHAIFHEQ